MQHISLTLYCTLRLPKSTLLDLNDSTILSHNLVYIFPVALNSELTASKPAAAYPPEIISSARTKS